MISNQIVLRYKFDFFKRTSLLLFSLIPLLLIVQLLLNSVNFLGALVVLFFLVFFVAILSLSFLKKGLVHINEELYKAYFIFGTRIFKYKIDLTDRTVVSILKNYTAKKMILKGGSSQSSKIRNYEVNVLNEKQTKRDVLFLFKKETEANKAVKFIKEHTSLKVKVHK